MVLPHDDGTSTIWKFSASIASRHFLLQHHQGLYPEDKFQPVPHDCLTTRSQALMLYTSLTQHYTTAMMDTYLSCEYYRTLSVKTRHAENPRYTTDVLLPSLTCSILPVAHRVQTRPLNSFTKHRKCVKKNYNNVRKSYFLIIEPRRIFILIVSDNTFL